MLLSTILYNDLGTMAVRMNVMLMVTIIPV